MEKLEKLNDPRSTPEDAASRKEEERKKMTTKERLAAFYADDPDDLLDKNEYINTNPFEDVQDARQDAPATLANDGMLVDRAHTHRALAVSKQHVGSAKAEKGAASEEREARVNASKEDSKERRFDRLLWLNTNGNVKLLMEQSEPCVRWNCALSLYKLALELAKIDPTNLMTSLIRWEDSGQQGRVSMVKSMMALLK